MDPLNCTQIIADPSGLTDNSLRGDTRDVTHLTRVNVSCFSSHVLSGPASITCQNGTWLPSVPTCTNVDDCAASPCKNGAACLDGVSKYTCVCPFGFQGATCDTTSPDFYIAIAGGVFAGLVLTVTIVAVLYAIMNRQDREQEEKKDIDSHGYDQRWNGHMGGPYPQYGRDYRPDDRGYPDRPQSGERPVNYGYPYPDDHGFPHGPGVNIPRPSVYSKFLPENREEPRPGYHRDYEGGRPHYRDERF